MQRIRVLILVIVGSIPALSRAELPSELTDRRDDVSRHGNVGIDFAVTRQPGTSITGIAPAFWGAWYPSSTMRLDVAWAMPGGFFTTPRYAYVDLGNPMIALSGVGESGAWRFRIGGFASFPVASVPGATGALDDGSTGQRETAHRLAAAARGYWDAFLVQPGVLALGLPFHLDVVPAAGWLIAFEATAYAKICTTTTECTSTAFVFQAAIDGGFRTGVLGVGLRGQVVEWTSSADHAQTSVEPWLDVHMGASTLRFSALANIDKPSGSSFATGGVWGMRLGFRALL